MERLSRVKAEHLLSRHGLKPALDYLDRNIASHPLYTRDYALDVVLTAHSILNIERGPQVDINLLIASLFLRMPTADGSYVLRETIVMVRNFFKVHTRSGSEERVIAYILDQETALRPVTEMGNVLHDAEILAFLVQPAPVIIEFIRGKLNQDAALAKQYLEQIVIQQTMHTPLGREILRDMSASILIDLRA